LAELTLSERDVATVRALDVRLFGGFTARAADGCAIVLPRKAHALIARLALAPAHTLARESLVALLWGASPDEHARHSLRQTLHLLRGALGDDVLDAGRDTIALDVTRMTVDVLQFEHDASVDDTDAQRRAAALYRGDLLDGIRVDEPPFEEWLCGERERLRERLFEVLARLLAHEQRAGAFDAAIQSAVRLVSLDSLLEPVHRTLMRLYVASGRRASAMRQYRLCEDALSRELGIAPEPETTELYREIVTRR
jgi:DNA-binding SARP family transcriptional activator